VCIWDKQRTSGLALAVHACGWWPLHRGSLTKMLNARQQPTHHVCPCGRSALWQCPVCTCGAWGSCQAGARLQKRDRRKPKAASMSLEPTGMQATAQCALRGNGHQARGEMCPAIKQRCVACGHHASSALGAAITHEAHIGPGTPFGRPSVCVCECACMCVCARVCMHACMC